ncbi:MAG: S1C family serine protease [Microbacteriaceae bacterium]
MENNATPESAPVRRRVRKPVVDAATVDTAATEPSVEPGETEQPPARSWLAGTIPTKAAAGVAVIAGVAGGVAGAGIGFLGNGGFGFNSVIQPQAVTISDTDNTSAVTAVAAKALQSVVTIEVTGTNGAGSGSGVVISADGYIVTNNHVVTHGGADTATSLRVTLADGRLYSAKVIGTDPILDVAVIKIAETGLVPAEWGDSSAVTVGDESVAIGAPLGLENTVTDGVVSALNRSITISNKGDGFNFDLPDGQQSAIAQDLSLPVIQTDASINPGNSGGALLNAEGQFIGMNVAIASSGSSSGSIGVGFALPSNIVKRVAEDIIADGKAAHGRIGATVSAVSASTGVVGALVHEITAGSPAEKSGLKTKDVVTSFNGVPIRNEVDLTAQVRSLRPGDTATMVVVRNGVSKSLSVTVGSLE